ncbi:Heat shock protein DnaJ-like [Crocosphaera chwakensis CCY0110]|uniref:Heat shock protein DnaJ-like n=2 Tax=Crocosphaera TaxID=263510 RepID=A3IRB0_9CHRO|nr:J domain-containing protein [Crocosphaera chwakensis]EAZ90912.1 Heat shock protein DnaJ-like [Crocosphaera chwakensis CCY0110]
MPFANSHYAILGLHPSASVIEIRRAYRELSKRYHPDTTELPSAMATAKFQRLNEAYGVLSNPQKRSLYDLQIGYSRLNVIQDPSIQRKNPKTGQWSNSAYLDASDRPLSGGELFALFILGLTLMGCLVLAIFIAILRGDEVIPNTALSQNYASVVPIFASKVYYTTQTLITLL